jgi:hypothetical protein
MKIMMMNRVIKSRSMRYSGHVARVGEMRNVYTILVGKPEGRTPFERHRRRWENNIKVGYEVLTAVKMSIVVLCVVTPSGLGGGYQRFGGMYCFQLHFTTGSSWSRGSSGSIVSDYGLDGRGWIPDRGGFFL